MKLKWYGTAALLVFDEQSVIAFDPFLGICHGDSHPERISMNGVGALMPVSDVFVTHGHFDHIIHSDTGAVCRRKRNNSRYFHAVRNVKKSWSFGKTA